MLFHFQLTPVDEIGPWTTPSRNNEKHLHWFGLTDGCYWLDVGHAELFRYSPVILERWAKTHPEVSVGPYVGYQVVRLWEDVLDMLRSVLEPVPEDLARHVRPGGVWESRAAWRHWRDTADDWMERQDDDAYWDLVSLASGWWAARALDSGHLRANPGIWFWREADVTYVRWDNRDILLDGLLAWSAEAGEMSMTADAFLEEVRSFNERLFQAMGQRVDAVCEHWPRPEIRIDCDDLRRDHLHRSMSLDNALTRPPLATDWDVVRAAFAELERHLSEEHNDRS